MKIKKIQSKKGLLMPIDILSIVLILVSLTLGFTLFTSLKAYDLSPSEVNEDSLYLYANTLSYEMNNQILSEELKKEIRKDCNNVNVNSINELIFLKHSCENYDLLINKLNVIAHSNLNTYFNSKNDFIEYKNKVNTKKNGRCYSYFSIINDETVLDIGWRNKKSWWPTLRFKSEFTRQIEEGNSITIIPGKDANTYLVMCYEVTSLGGL